MGRGLRVFFDTDGRDANEWLVTNYVRPATERLDQQGHLDGFYFYRDYERSRFAVVFDGDFEAIRTTEREVWNDLREAGRIDDWEADVIDVLEGRERKFGSEEAAELALSFMQFSSRQSLRFYEEFEPEERPEPVDTFPENDGLGLGRWVMLHQTLAQQGYDHDDEIETCLEAIRNRLLHVKSFHSEEAALDRAEEVLEEVEQFREEIEAAPL